MVQAYRNSLIIPAHKKYLAVSWRNCIYVQNNAIEGLCLVGGIQGTPADACIEILHSNGIHPISKWVDDFVIFRSPSLLPLLDDIPGYDYDLLSVFRITYLLGIPWHAVANKGQDFASRFKYLGFVWDLMARSVSLPDNKCEWTVSKLTSFLAKQRVMQNDCASLHSTLQHVSFMYQDACSALPALSRVLSKFSNNFVLHHIPHAVLKDLDF